MEPYTWDGLKDSKPKMSYTMCAHFTAAQLIVRQGKNTHFRVTVAAISHVTVVA